MWAGGQVKEEGWLPQHILLRSAETKQLLACVPLYLKGHSYGEYVFDNSWAVLASRLGQRYYVRPLVKLREEHYESCVSIWIACVHPFCGLSVIACS